MRDQYKVLSEKYNLIVYKKNAATLSNEQDFGGLTEGFPTGAIENNVDQLAQDLINAETLDDMENLIKQIRFVDSNFGGQLWHLSNLPVKKGKRHRWLRDVVADLLGAPRVDVPTLTSQIASRSHASIIDSLISSFWDAVRTAYSDALYPNKGWGSIRSTREKAQDNFNKWRKAYIEYKNAKEHLSQKNKETGINLDI